MKYLVLKAIPQVYVRQSESFIDFAHELCSNRTFVEFFRMWIKTVLNVSVTDIVHEMCKSQAMSQQIFKHFDLDLSEVQKAGLCLAILKLLKKDYGNTVTKYLQHADEELKELI